MSNDRPCPSIETIAALAEGVPDEKEREPLMDHLDTCTSCYTLFSEIAATLEESSASEQSSDGETPVESSAKVFKLRRTPLVWAGPMVAAALLLLVLQLLPPSPEKAYWQGIEAMASGDGSVLVDYKPSRDVTDDVLSAARVQRGSGENTRVSADLLEAIDILVTRLAKAPDDLETRLDLVFLYLGAGKYDQAKVTAAEAGEDPRARCFFYLSHFLAYRTNPGSSFSGDIQTLADQHPESSLVIYNVARMLEGLGRRDEALALWHRYLDLEPNSARASAIKEQLE
ncbi:MAG: tetratricopeptide repeat protein [Acidobacteriota bacterium]|nr:tetratricopeptide repeat protein [Acidobacteriota bacterium]